MKRLELLKAAPLGLLAACGGGGSLLSTGIGASPLHRVHRKGLLCSPSYDSSTNTLTVGVCDGWDDLSMCIPPLPSGGFANYAVFKAYDTGEGSYKSLTYTVDSLPKKKWTEKNLIKFTNYFIEDILGFYPDDTGGTLVDQSSNTMAQWHYDVSKGTATYTTYIGAPSGITGTIPWNGSGSGSLVPRIINPNDTPCGMATLAFAAACALLGLALGASVVDWPLIPVLVANVVYQGWLAQQACGQ